MRKTARFLIGIMAFVLFLTAWNAGARTGQAAGAAGTVGPVSAMASGKIITLTFDVSLLSMTDSLTTQTPVDPSILIARAASQFMVKVNNKVSIPTLASASGKTVALFLKNETAASDIITVTYRPGSAPLKDISGNAIASFSDYFVPTTIPEFVPKLEEIKASGKRIFLFYDEELDQSSVPPANNFQVLNGAGALRVVGVTVQPNYVELELHDYITVGKSLTLRYSPTTTPIKSKKGYSAAPIPTYSIPNTGKDTTTGNGSGTSSGSGTGTPANNGSGSSANNGSINLPHVNSASVNGQVLTMTFSTELNESSVPKVGQFYVKVDGSAVSVSTVTVSGNLVVLKLAKSVTPGQTVAVSYYDTGNLLEAVNGQPVSAFTDYPAASGTAAGGGQPAAVEGDGAAGFKLSSQGWVSSTGVTPSGSTVPLYTIDAAKLTEAYRALKASQASKPEIAMPVPASDLAALVRVPVQALMDAQAQISNASFRIDYGDFSFTFPLSAIGYSQELKALGADAADSYLQFGIEKKSGTDALLSAAYAQGLSLVSLPVDFSASWLWSGGQKKVTEYGMFVERSITVPNTLASNPDSLMVIRYDEAAGQLAYVPTLGATANGLTSIRFLSRSSGEYAVVRTGKSAFKDMAKHWAKSDVEQLASKWIVDGTSETAFSPDQNITRADFAKFIVKGMGLSGDKSAAAQFTDVDAKSVEAAYIGAASKAGIVAGGTDGRFRPDAAVTREEMASMLVRAMNYAGVSPSVSEDALSKFFDRANVSTYAKPAVAACVNAGIISGVTANSFRPKDNATRAQATSMIKRFLNNVGFLP